MSRSPGTATNSFTFPDLAAIRAAHERIRPYVNRTPVLKSSSLDGMIGAEVCFKCENFQKVGAFKARGAHNAVFSLSDAEAARGVVTHSSGNHAAALALAARRRGIPAHIVMPNNAPEVKKKAVARYGARIVYCEPTVEARESTAEKVRAETGAAFIHPYDDDRVIAGQATAALELLEEIPGLDIVMAPVGGGGLLSGTALAAHYLRPDVRVIGAEPAGADDAARSLAARKLELQLAPRTIADGLLTSLSPRTFAILSRHLDSIVTVSEQEITDAMRLAWEVLKVVIEPSAAVPLAALFKDTSRWAGRRIGVIFSGGNVDLTKLPWL